MLSARYDPAIGDNGLRPYGLFAILARRRQTTVKQRRLLHKCGDRVEFSRGGGQYVTFHRVALGVSRLNLQG